MTLRDYFAIQIAAAAIANPATTCPWGSDFIPEESYKLADRMLNARKKKFPRE